MVHCLLALLPPAHALRTSHRLQNRLSLRLCSRRGHQVAAEISHLGRPHARPRLRHLRPLHASGLHARLESTPKQIQIPVPPAPLPNPPTQFPTTPPPP